MLISACTVCLSDFFPRKIALGLDPLQRDTPCVHVFNSKALPINKVQKEIINSKGA